jgi:hypothetical protein
MKINSALLRLTKDALLKAEIELPDPAREIVFPRGVPIVPTQGAENAEARHQGSVGRAHLEEDENSQTIGEGGLRNEAINVCEQSEGEAPEADENLLKR